MKTIKTIVAATLAAGTMFSVGNAAACDLTKGGFLAGVVKCVAPPLAPVADAADRMNGALGNPVDHAIAAGANVFVPGSGTALEAGWAIQRSGVLNGVGQVPQHVPMGNFCLTPSGRFGPGPMQPIGSFCQAGTPWGFVAGSVGR